MGINIDGKFLRQLVHISFGLNQAQTMLKQLNKESDKVSPQKFFPWLSLHFVMYLLHNQKPD